ncbi:MAG TPA: lipoyl(octanoyl) transferase LipB [Candidatus Baltobacteraceae bacterium]|nr:lipoyl(octanoyl) transferase LipB [Candidatus Baltobacteraceae bacterium]
MSQAAMLDLGLSPYRTVWDLQHRLHDAVQLGHEGETWIFVEHPPVVTLGRKADRRNVLLSREALAARGIDLVEIERGGDVTYHGPGQLVVYPIRRLERFREVVPLVRALEQAVIDTCAHFGVQAERWSEHAGVWTGRNQICAVGLAVRKMTSLHGIALNVSTELDYDRVINPCGLTDRGITSLSRETGRPVSIAEVKPVLAQCIETAFGLSFSPSIPQDGAAAWQSKSA